MADPASRIFDHKYSTTEMNGNNAVKTLKRGFSFSYKRKNS